MTFLPYMVCVSLFTNCSYTCDILEFGPCYLFSFKVFTNFCFAVSLLNIYLSLPNVTHFKVDHLYCSHVCLSLPILVLSNVDIFIDNTNFCIMVSLTTKLVIILVVAWFLLKPTFCAACCRSFNIFLTSPIRTVAIKIFTVYIYSFLFPT